MKNEELNVVVMENEISVIEENHHNAILSIHENMQQLVADCNDIKVVEDDKETYDRAVELKRVVKSTHVAIEKKRKELKQPLIDYGKRLDKWVEGIYSPLVQAEKLVKQKMEVYEAKQEILKAERKALEDKQQAQEQEIEDKLKNLNATLGMINSASSKNELNEINSSLEKVVLSEYGKKSDEAGFILNQLKLTCSMALRLMKDEEPTPVVESPKIESTPITDDFIQQLKDINVEQPVKIAVEDLSDFTKEEVTEQIEPIIKEEVVLEQIEPTIENENIVEVKDDSAFEVFSKKPTDNDIINLIDSVSKELIKDVTNYVNSRTEPLVNSFSSENKLDLSVQKDFVLDEIRKRIGVLLKSN
jgi:hypothetical protein